MNTANTSLHSPSIPPKKSTLVISPDAGKRVFFLLLIGLFSTIAVQSILENLSLSQSFLSPSSWQALVTNGLRGELVAEELPQGQVRYSTALVPFFPCLLLVAGSWLLLAGLTFLMVPRLEFSSRLSVWLKQIFWWGFLACWGVLWLLVMIFNMADLAAILQGTLVFWVSLVVAGSLYEVAAIRIAAASSITADASAAESNDGRRRLFWLVPVAAGLFMLVFTAMNWGLWFNLRLPHGDSSMYEEHLWNVIHGKGFRSYLDQGLFWGEHIQFFHLFLIPLYWFWPSHLLLELCQSAALAAGAVPVFWLARRHGGSERAALLLSLAYLLYFPLHFLDISVDLKTFRPMAFSVVIVLLAIDQLERQRFKTATALLLLSLTCKEDLSITVFSIGLVLVAEMLWQVWQQRRHRATGKIEESSSPWKSIGWKYGVAYLCFGPVYLLLALRAIRWFRSGVEVHYAGYFTRFGNSTNEIIWNMLTNPGLLLGELLTGSTLIYALAILLPLGFLPLRSPLRLLGCLPMFVLLCLNELASDPRHHFHAPLVPLIFWAAAAGLGSPPLISWRKLFRKPQTEPDPSLPEQQVVRQQLVRQRAAWAVCCSFATALWFSMSPVGVPFWDSGSAWNWKNLYWPGERARMFARIEQQIPQTARVASTDYVHPRFTHHERSYDYSNYVRKVSGYTVNVPEDTEYIVIDTRHPYSTIHSVEQIREMQQEPEKWEVLPDETAGYFIILKRRQPVTGTP